MMKALSFYAGGECFAADVSAVSKVARDLGLTPVPAAPEGVAGLAGLKGKVVTMLDLAVLRGAKPSTVRPGDKVNAVVFKGTQAAPDAMGFIIERPGELIEIDPEALARPRLERDLEFIAGHYEENGTFYSVIDINSIIGRFKEGGGRNAAERQRGAGNE